LTETVAVNVIGWPTTGELVAERDVEVAARETLTVVFPDEPEKLVSPENVAVTWSMPDPV
jgi:hypothetical protein